MDAITPRHQWTNGGIEVLVVKWVNANGTSYRGFTHPLKVGDVVTAPDWNDKPECGGGIHGWPWCFSLGEGKAADFAAHWLVYGVDPKDVICLDGGKVKFRTGTVRHSGDWHGAMMYVLAGQMAWVRHASSGAATASGDNGAATASGYNGAATASGDNGAATASGDNGAATASGYSGAATASGHSGAATASGDSGAATASGYSGAATASGTRGAATASGKALAAVVTGVSGKARAPECGCIALAWWNAKKKRSQMRCAVIGKDKGQLKPDTWYRLDDDGNFVEVEVTP